MSFLTCSSYWVSCLSCIIPGDVYENLIYCGITPTSYGFMIHLTVKNTQIKANHFDPNAVNTVSWKTHRICLSNVFQQNITTKTSHNSGQMHMARSLVWLQLLVLIIFRFSLIIGIKWFSFVHLSKSFIKSHSFLINLSKSWYCCCSSGVFIGSFISSLGLSLIHI